MTSDIFSDLVLSRYVIADLSLKSRVEQYGQRIAGGNLGLAFEVRTNPETKNKYQLELTVLVNPDESSFEEGGLRISATIVGFFTWRPQAPDDEPTNQDMQRVLVNGLSVLYGTLRPLLTAIAQQAGRHRFTLPTVDMRKYLDDHVKSRAVDLESLTVPQLRELANERGINIAGKRRRADLLKAISQYFASSEADEVE